MNEIKNEMTPEQSNNAVMLQAKLMHLKVNASFIKLEAGPVVTGYYFKPAQATPVSKLMKLGEDLALATDSERLTIQRVSGHIVVFVPNEKREVVEFKDYLHWYMTNDSEEFKSQILPIPLGVDYKGNKSTFDLTTAPHVLIAGSTGAGKSVFESAIISCLCYKLSSDYLHLYLVDTKKVDLPLFSTLPHVKATVDNLDDFHFMMSKIMPEIRRRLTVLQGMSCRNIAEYHHMMGTEFIRKMPYIVIMMDEFGDLMELDYAARKALKDKYDEIPSVKSWIKSLVQIGRAAGVHLIACTQRSSVKVVDGDIKANLPTRIALRLPTGVDSRTILGTIGAENLLGKGDMLVQRMDSDIIERFHGPYVSMNDIIQLVNNYEQIKTMFAR